MTEMTEAQRAQDKVGEFMSAYCYENGVCAPDWVEKFVRAAYACGVADARAEQSQKLVGISEADCPCSPCHARRAVEAFWAQEHT